MLRVAAVALALVTPVFAQLPGRADSLAEQAAPFIDEHTLVYVRVDVSRLDLETLLAPVSDEAPAGPDLAYDPVRSEVDQAFDSPVSVDANTGETVAPDIDWRKVVRQIDEQSRETKGSTLVYTTANETYVIKGSPVKILDQCQRETIGRTLTFNKGADSIVVDGNAQIRTQTKGGNGNCS